MQNRYATMFPARPSRAWPLAAALALLTAGGLSAQKSERLAAQPAPAAARPAPKRNAPREMTAERIPAHASAPVIDGRLDDAVWADARVADAFTQIQPDPGAAATLRTEVRIAYDADAIYVAARMYDPHPDSIAAQLTRRDEVGYSGQFLVAFDSYHDHRTGYAFALTPSGVKQDVFLYDDTKSDVSWDAVWDGAARVDSLGWTAEFRIPLSQLRFNLKERGEDGKLVWGVDFKRTIARYNEQAVWAPIPREVDRVVSLFGELHGLSGLASPRRLEVVPYSVARLTRAPADPGDPFHSANDLSTTAGADVKYGLGPDLTLTATVNPDFGQVEADPSVVNLSAYETFFPEKRPFFVEGADIFRFGIGFGDGSMGNEQLFYSRRIGRSPQGPVPDSAAFSSMPSSTTILGAAKLSGKTASGWSVGVLDAVTGQENARTAGPQGGRLGRIPVEPLTNYGVARLIRTSSDGQSAVGGVFTATNRRLDDPSLDFLRSAAYSGGANVRHRWGGGNYEVTGWLLGSEVLGSDSAIAQTQRSSTHYYQRPDAGYLHYDPTRTSLAGWAADLSVARTGGGHWSGGFIGNVRSPGFEVNDLGYQQNADLVISGLYGSYSEYRPGPLLRDWRVNASAFGGWNFGGDPLDRELNVNGHFTLLSNWGGGLGVNRNMARIETGALRGGPSIQAPGRTSLNAWVYSDDRNPVSVSLSGWLNREDGTGGRSGGLSPNISVRPSGNVQLSLGPSIDWNRDAWQYVAEADTPGGARYVFGSLRQTTVSLTTRLNYTFSPTLSLQLYAQPFVSAGRYSRFRQIVDPRAAAFSDRFHTYAPSEIHYDPGAESYTVDPGAGARAFSFDQPDFGVRELRSNAVLRWEYRPGSTLFIVWSQGRSIDDSDGSFRFSHDARALFSAPGTNVLLVKFSYWLGL